MLFCFIVRFVKYTEKKKGGREMEKKKTKRFGKPIHFNKSKLRDPKTGRLMCINGVSVCDPCNRSAKECMYCGG